MNARAPRPFLQLVVDNTEAAALRARNLQLADDIETISDIARGGRISTFAWIIVRPNGETEQGILGKQGTDLTGVLRGARNLQKIFQKRIDEGANASQGARL